jgi:hypothetical protein
VAIFRDLSTSEIAVRLVAKEFRNLKSQSVISSLIALQGSHEIKSASQFVTSKQPPAPRTQFAQNPDRLLTPQQRAARYTARAYLPRPGVASECSPDVHPATPGLLFGREATSKNIDKEARKPRVLNRTISCIPGLLISIFLSAAAVTLRITSGPARHRLKLAVAAW